MIRVGVAGAAGRMGATVCAAVEDAEGMEIAGKADPALGTELAEILDEVDVVVDEGADLGLALVGHGAGALTGEMCRGQCGFQFGDPLGVALAIRLLAGLLEVLLELLAERGEGVVEGLFLTLGHRDSDLPFSVRARRACIKTRLLE